MRKILSWLHVHNAAVNFYCLEPVHATCNYLQPPVNLTAFETFLLSTRVTFLPNHHPKLAHMLKFKITAVNLDQQQPGWDGSSLEAWLKEEGVDYRMLSEVR